MFAFGHNNLALTEVPSYKLQFKATLNCYSYTAYIYSIIDSYRN